MDTTLQFVTGLITSSATKVAQTFMHNWVFLLLSIVISVPLRLYVDQNKVATFLRRNQKGSVWLATAAAVGTPFCSCGTMAVILGMMASMMPWAPIVAFMVSSPLTSPEGMFYTAALFGWPFSIAFMLSSILLGLAGGMLAHVFESRGWLKNQARLMPNPTLSAEQLPVTGGGTEPPAKKRVTFGMLARQFYTDGGRLLLMFFGFAFLGYLLNGLIPAAWLSALFGEGHAYSVPLAATFGLPFYINSEASLPLVRAMLDSGMSQGAALAFLITGAGTSIGAMGGALTIARKRIIALVIGTLWGGSILLGLAYDLVMRLL